LYNDKKRIGCLYCRNFRKNIPENASAFATYRFVHLTNCPKVPQSFEALEALPAVGHKTASVVMSQAFGVPAFPVDTHIHRLAYRWKLSNGKSVKQTEKDLKRLFEKALWNKLHLQIIFFGREHCPARGHQPENCPICKVIGRKEMEKKWAALKR